MLLSAVSVLVVAQSSSEIQEGLMNNPVCVCVCVCVCVYIYIYIYIYIKQRLLLFFIYPSAEIPVPISTHACPFFVN